MAGNGSGKEFVREISSASSATTEAYVGIQTNMATGNPSAALQSIDNDVDDGMVCGSQETLKMAVFVFKVNRNAKSP